MLITKENFFKYKTYYSGELKSDKEGFTFAIDLPGIQKENIEISLTGKKVGIVATRKKVETELIYEESFSVPFSIEAIEAQLIDGVLKLKGKWKESEKPQKIEIK